MDECTVVWMDGKRWEKIKEKGKTRVSEPREGAEQRRRRAQGGRDSSIEICARPIPSILVE